MKLIRLEAVTKFIASLSKREKIVFYSAAAVVSLVVLDRMIISPVSKKIATLAKEIETKEMGIKKDIRVVSQKDRILSESAKYAQFLGGVKSEEEQATSLQKEIETLTNKSSVYLVDMKPAGFKASGSSKRFLVNVNCEATMQQIVDFMYAIESSSKLLTIERYQLSQKSEDSGLVICSMTIAKIVIP